MKVAFLHPDLGIGGAERLVVDAALALKELGHDVTLYTSHHDPQHCFDETRDGTLEVKVLGNTLFPRTIGGKLSILCAILRQLHLVKELAAQGVTYDLFIIDQLSAAIPYLRLAFPKSRTLFYCHHPDLLLTDRATLVKKAYRYPFDTFERWSTSLSDQICVNSEYTRKVFLDTFGRESMPDPSIVYPVVDANAPVVQASSDGPYKKLAPFTDPSGERRIALSINRFERKKNVDLAVEAYSLLMHAHVESQKHLLVIAGGYDERIRENIEHLKELQDLATTLRVPHATRMPGQSWRDLDLAKVRILFLPSVNSQLKDYLLKNAAVLLYTPTNEHFGIVPLEAMRAETPVLATNTGGPLETVEDKVTGWLEPSDVEAWYRVLRPVLMQVPMADLRHMGAMGRERVLKQFTLGNLKEQLARLAEKTVETPRKNEGAVANNVKMVTAGIGLSAAAAVVFGILLVMVAFWIMPILVRSTQW